MTSYHHSARGKTRRGCIESEIESFPIVFFVLSFFLSFPFTMGGIILRDVPLSSIQPSLRLGFLRLTFGPLPPISSRDPVSRIKRIVKSRGIFFLFLSLSFSNPRLRNWHFRDRQVGECNKRRRIEPPLKDSLLAASQVRVFEPNFLATSK